MPRFTYDPSVSSEAARAAICSLDHAMSGLRSGRGTGSHGPLLDLLLRHLFLGERHDPLHVHTGGVYVVRADLTRLDELLDLGDGHPAAHRGERVEVARRLPEHQVAVPVPLPGPH